MADFGLDGADSRKHPTLGLTLNHVKDYYRLLGLPFGAPVDKVRARYRELARLYHPDVSKDPAAEEKMRQLNEAYQVLSEPELRLRYHLLLLAQRERQRRKRQKTLQKAWMTHQRRFSANKPVPLYLRYVLLILLLSVAAAAALYHFHHPFPVHKAHLNGYGWPTWPPFLELPPSVTELYLQDNRFSEVPAIVWSLPQLKILRLDGNAIQTLSSRITTLKDLEVLSLRGNQLTALPRGWGELTRLREIDLRDNQLSQVPLELLELPKLERLDLRGNPLSPTMRNRLAQQPHPGILWDAVRAEPDRSQKSPTDDSGKDVLAPATGLSMPHAGE